MTILHRMLAKLNLRRRRKGYRSPLGGTWTDRTDALERLEMKLEAGAIDDQRAEQLRFWIDNGYVILKQAVDPATVDALNRDIEQFWASLDPRIKIELGGAHPPLDRELRNKRYKLLDFYVFSEAARAAAFAPSIRDFLRCVFESDALLFQALSFEHGSGDPVHQDTGGVVVSSPLEFAAAWIALEDIRPGTGELVYYEGSHRLPEHFFRGGFRNWNRQRDGDASYQAYLAGIHEKARAMGLPLRSFLPRKGDALIWAADLAHGGSDFDDPTATRKSLVSHYCPTRCTPYYFSYQTDHRTVRALPGQGSICSSHYRLDEWVQP